MDKRPVDKTKKSNIKCEHCKYWETIDDSPHYKFKQCGNNESPKYQQETEYWKRCKQFEWRED